MLDSFFNATQRLACKRSKGRAFEKRLCVSIVAVSDLLVEVEIFCQK